MRKLLFDAEDGVEDDHMHSASFGNVIQGQSPDSQALRYGGRVMVVFDEKEGPASISLLRELLEKPVK